MVGLLTIVAALMVIWVGTVFVRAWAPRGWTLVLPRLMAAALLPLIVLVIVIGAPIAVWRGGRWSDQSLGRLRRRSP